MPEKRVDIAEFIEQISNVKNQRNFINSCIQQALDRVFEFHDWPFYLMERALETVAVYDTGDVDVTNGSKTISGGTTSPTFTEAMVGRKFRVNGESPSYRIAAYVSATELTLEQNYQGDDDTDQSYEIYKDEYRLTADVDKYKTMRQIQNRVCLVSFNPTEFDNVIPSPTAYADPTIEIMVGTNLDTYTDGTVTTSGTTITGVSTEWAGVEGLGRMSEIRIGNNVYTVKSVDSDTQITTYETMITVAAASTHEIKLNNLVVQLYQIPNTARLLYYRAFRIPEPLSNDYDLADMPPKFRHLLKWGALSEVLSYKGDINKAENVYETRFLNGLNQMKLKLGSFTPDRNYQRKSVDRARYGTGRGVEKSTYDIRYST